MTTPIRFLSTHISQVIETLEIKTLVTKQPIPYSMITIPFQNSSEAQTIYFLFALSIPSDHYTFCSMESHRDYVTIRLSKPSDQYVFCPMESGKDSVTISLYADIKDSGKRVNAEFIKLFKEIIVFKSATLRQAWECSLEEKINAKLPSRQPDDFILCKKGDHKTIGFYSHFANLKELNLKFNHRVDSDHNFVYGKEVDVTKFMLYLRAFGKSMQSLWKENESDAEDDRHLKNTLDDCSWGRYSIL